MTEERRNDSEIRVISERLDNLIRDVKEEKAVSLEWRKLFCAKLDAYDTKLDAMILKLNQLPCPIRAEQHKHLVHQLRALWLVTGGMLLTIITEWLGRK